MKKENLILNKILFLLFLIFMSVNTLCELYDTDEVMLFKKKAEQVIKKLENKDISSGMEEIKDINQKMKILEIINFFGEASNSLEKKDFEKVRDILSKISVILDTLEYKKENIRLLDKKISCLQGNRVCVELKFKNISGEIIQDAQVRVKLTDESGKSVREKIFSTMRSYIRDNEDTVERFYFYNIENIDSIKDSEIDFVISAEE